MYKKSVTRSEKENESSQVELTNPALQDIIATNHIVLTKKPHKERLSRACKAVIVMIILGFVAIGIIVLTLILAHSRNNLITMISRSTETNQLAASNNSRILFINQENLTTITDEQKEENWKKITVILTSNNLHRLTTQNVHISSSIMRTQQQNEHISSNTQSMKPYPSSNTIVNEQSTIATTIQTTISNQQTTFVPSSHHSTTIMTTENELITSMKSQEYVQTSTDDNHMTNIVNDTSTLIQDDMTSIPEETSFTTFINRHFNIQSSTINNNNQKKKYKLVKNYKNDEEEEDIIDDLLFS